MHFVLIVDGTLLEWIFTVFNPTSCASIGATDGNWHPSGCTWNNALHARALVRKLCTIGQIIFPVSGSFIAHSLPSIIGSTLISVATGSYAWVTNKVPNVTASLALGAWSTIVGGGWVAEPFGCGVLNWSHETAGYFYMILSLGVVSISNMSRFHLASTSHWIRFWDAFLTLFLLLPINFPLTFIDFACAVALILWDGDRVLVIGGGDVGVCNTLVLLCLEGYWCTTMGGCLLNTGSITLVSGSASTLRVGRMVTPAALSLHVPASMMPPNCWSPECCPSSW